MDRSCNAACVSSNSRPILLKMGVTAAYFLAGVSEYEMIAAGAADDADKLQEHRVKQPIAPLEEGEPTMMERMAEAGSYLEDDQVPTPEYGDGRDVLNVMRTIPAPWRRQIGRRLNLKKPRDNSIGKMVLESVWDEVPDSYESEYASAI